MTLGERIQRARKDRGLSQEALGEALGVTRQSISKWESDTAVPELDKLIAMSRLFHMSIGDLLGVEEPEEAEQELTERELQALTAIAEKLAASTPRPVKKKKWPKLLAGAVVLAILAVAGGEMAERMSRLENQLSNLRDNMSLIERNVAARVTGITEQVEEVLESQNAITANQGYEIASADFLAGTVTFSIWATPRVYQEGMQAKFLASGASWEKTGSVAADGVEKENCRFETLLTCPLDDDITLSVTFENGAERLHQVLEHVFDLETQSKPQIYAQGGLFFSDLRGNGENQTVLQLHTLRFGEEAGYLETKEKTYDVTVQSLTVRIWRGENVIWSQLGISPVTEEQAETGTDREWETEVKEVNIPLFDLTKGERFVLSALVTDSVGRSYETCVDVASVTRYEPESKGDLWLEPDDVPETLPWEAAE